MIALHKQPFESMEAGETTGFLSSRAQGKGEGEGGEEEEEEAEYETKSPTAVDHQFKTREDYDFAKVIKSFCL